VSVAPSPKSASSSEAGGITSAFTLAVAGAMLLGAFLRMWKLELHGLWLDELFTVRVVSMDSWSGLVQQLAIDVHPPLYYASLRLWSAVAGTTDMAWRLPSALAGVCSVGGAAVLGRHLFGPMVGMGSAWMVAVSPFIVALDREARGNAWMLCLGLWASVILAGNIKSKMTRKVMVSYLACSVALVYTHVFGIFVLVGHLVWLILEWMDEAVVSPRQWACAIGAALASVLPWSPWLFGQVQGFRADPWYAVPSADSLGYLWFALSRDFSGLAISLGLGVALVLVNIAAHDADEKSTRMRTGVLCAISMVVGLVLVPQVISYVVAPILRPRNVVVLLAVMCVVSSAGWLSLGLRVVRISCFVLVVGLHLLVTLRSVFYDHGREEWREAAAEVRDNWTEGERVFANHPYLWAHYLPGIHIESETMAVPQTNESFWVLAGHDTNHAMVQAVQSLPVAKEDWEFRGARALRVSPSAWLLDLEEKARAGGHWKDGHVAWYMNNSFRSSERLLSGKCRISLYGWGDFAGGEPAKIAVRVWAEGETVFADELQLPSGLERRHSAFFDAPRGDAFVELAFVNDEELVGPTKKEDRNAYLKQAWVACVAR